MQQQTILITGGCGFIGSNLAIQLKEKYPHYQIISLDNLKRRGSELNIVRLKDAGVQFIHGDIRNKEDLVFEHKIDYIIDAAAEPSVMAGMDATLNYVINTNLSGTINTLELAAKHQAKFIFLSTSRVYPIEHLENISYTEGDNRFEISKLQSLAGITEKGISEDFPLNKARSIYGATKLASELMIEEFREFFGVDYVINRCGVVAGPYQMGKVDQGVITLWVARHYWKNDVAYFGYGGKGKQVRDVMHILDLFDLVDYEIHNFDKVGGHTFNVGGGSLTSVSLKELTDICADVTGNKVNAASQPENRKGDIPLYITDCSRIHKHIGWQPRRTVTNIIEDIFHWINKNEAQLKKILN
ncbi:NAD-dependent epimerase/dehydratase family protein [Taibaiella soli]|uniref:3-beta hydroxysteroid dehydrogenase n=1 Tax=Taibaiella soli TaxID=1649169 RepID=A0A2W2BFJ5_9BACT|nr:NAD-dependent epimerase/dehydratase family protein [Taibaiella soli]PZF74647.1 3-beta hydroxysteroid dehydrogenase [Taibaiella soli]